MEEAAKAWPAELVMPLVFGHRWTLIGDHQQLPPFGDLEIKKVYEACLSSSRPAIRQLVDDRQPFRAMLELFRHLFDSEEFGHKTKPGHAAKEGAASDDAWLYGIQESPIERLDLQFRMDDVIARLIGKAFYPKAGLKSSPGLCFEKPAHGMVRPKFLAERSLVWLDTGQLATCRHEDGQWHNDGEADVVAELVGAFHPSPLVSDASSSRLAILSPYHEQNQRIRNRLPAFSSALVHTTDSFQGREADTVIVSLVRTNDAPIDDRFRRIGHLASPQRTNVLLSRAKRLLIIIGDFAHFRATRDTPWRTVCEYVEDLKARVVLETLESLR